MCSGKPKVYTPPPAAAPVSAPVEQQLTSMEAEGTKKKKNKGKRSLMIGTPAAKGTGVNI
jgi:hypothetical protein